MVHLFFVMQHNPVTDSPKGLGPKSTVFPCIPTKIVFSKIVKIVLSDYARFRPIGPFSKIVLDTYCQTYVDLITLHVQ